MYSNLLQKWTKRVENGWKKKNIAFKISYKIVALFTENYPSKGLPAVNREKGSPLKSTTRQLFSRLMSTTLLFSTGRRFSSRPELELRKHKSLTFKCFWYSRVCYYLHHSPLWWHFYQMIFYIYIHNSSSLQFSFQNVIFYLKEFILDSINSKYLKLLQWIFALMPYNCTIS